MSDEDPLLPIFIYGTLRKGCRAHARMEDARFLGEAELPGKLLYVNKYPGLVEAQHTQVKGEVYEVSEAVRGRLDQYEGCFCTPPDYLRLERTATKSDGKKLTVHTYVFQLLETASYEIPNGDWLAHMKEHPELNTF